MSGPGGNLVGAAARAQAATATEPRWVRRLLVGVAVGFVGLFIALPLALVLYHALAEGAGVFVAAVDDRAARNAIRLTLTVVAIVVPLNLIFGLAAAWAIARFRFRGRALLITLIDLPFAVSPVVAGLVFVTLFGAQGALGPWLADHDIKIIYALPGIVLATVFVTFPFVARELIPVMEAQGADEEEAAVVLGASGWQTFFRVTLPKIKWGLAYGVILCTARALGEYGAVSVVSGNVRGRTNTVPLHVEVLYNDDHKAAAFAVASLLLLVAIATLIARRLIEHRALQPSDAAATSSAPPPSSFDGGLEPAPGALAP